MFNELFNQQGLSLERLHVLLQLRACGSLIKAAGNDKGRQSRYSHCLRELSEFFGVELTTRAGKIIRLTAAGNQLAQIAQEHLQSLLQFRQEIRKELQTFRLAARDELLQWLVIPTIGLLRRSESPAQIVLQTRQLDEIVEMLQEQQLDFGLMPTNTIPSALKYTHVCTMKYAIVVPERLAPQRGMLTLKKALLECPHAATGSDDEIMHRINSLAKDLAGQFRPELTCDSVSHCVTAVRSGYYAALIPLQSWTPDSKVPCQVVEGAGLEVLDQPISLAWHPRLMEVRGPVAKQMKTALLAALGRKNEASY